MKQSPKTANDTLVSDPDAAMQRAILATRGTLSVSKTKIDSMVTKEKEKHKRK